MSKKRIMAILTFATFVLACGCSTDPPLESAANTEGTTASTTTIATTTSASTTLSETTTSESETTSTTTKETTTTSATNEIRADVKEALDSYEEFFDEYCAFMKKFNDNPSDLSLLGEYASFMAQYADAMDKLDKMKSDLNNAEMKYYLEVMNRINIKLLEIGET